MARVFSKIVRKEKFTETDAVRGASEACDQGVLTYSAGANERSNKEMHRLYKFDIRIELLVVELEKL